MTGEDSPVPEEETSACGRQKAPRSKFVKWVVETNESEGPKGLKAKASKAFPGAFRGNSNANTAKASTGGRRGI